jgi:hypothetical protein
MDIKELFPPPQRLAPGQQERIRRVLLDEISRATASGRARRTGRRWWVIAAPATAAAAVTALAVTLAVLASAASPVIEGPAPRSAGTPPQAARQILLAAAAKVAQQHPGKYWHFSFTSETINISDSGGGPPVDQWVDHKGTWWTNPECKQGLTDGAVMYLAGGLSDALDTTKLTYNLVKHWPTDPAGLTARIASYDSAKNDDLAALAELETEVPAPPGVRAAAYRAMAGLPGVQYQGTVKGGRTVYIPPRDGGPMVLVINPATGLIHAESWQPEPNITSVDTYLVAQWANHLPRVIPRNKYYCSRH